MVAAFYMRARFKIARYGIGRKIPQGGKFAVLIPAGERIAALGRRSGHCEGVAGFNNNVAHGSAVFLRDGGDASRTHAMFQAACNRELPVKLHLNRIGKKLEPPKKRLSGKRESCCKTMKTQIMGGLLTLILMRGCFTSAPRGAQS